MPTYIAVLRGINVSGKNIIKMDALKSALQSNGFKQVKTYIQSGNIVFETVASKNSVLEKRIHSLLQDEFSLTVPVLVRSLEEWFHIIAKNPFANSAGVDPKQLHCTLLSSVPDEIDEEKLNRVKQDDDYQCIEDVVYLNVKAGYSDTKLSNAFLEKQLGRTATTRNWSTMLKLLELARSITH